MNIPEWRGGLLAGRKRAGAAWRNGDFLSKEAKAATASFSELNLPQNTPLTGAEGQRGRE